MLALILIMVVFLPIAVLPPVLESLFSPDELTEMGVQFK